jgi:phosphatidate cytidylyltransferase
MALNLKKLGTRAITALVFVIVLLSCLLWNYYSFTLFFFIISMWGLLEFFQAAEKLGVAPYKPVGFIIGGLTYLAFVIPSFLNLNFSYNPILSLLVMFPFIIFGRAILDKSAAPFTNAIYTVAGVLYSALPFGLMHELVIIPSDIPGEIGFFPYTFLGVIFLIWSNDTFAYLGGSILGKRKMIERVSPGKTWEGTITGVLCSFGVSFLLRHFLQAGSDIFWIAAGLIVPVLATVGDLLQSVIKRQAGLKDTGNIMPGHGGILDRFDSLIFVTPFVVVIFKVISLLNGYD